MMGFMGGSAGGGGGSTFAALTDKTITVTKANLTAYAGLQLASTGIAYKRTDAATYVQYTGEWLVSGSASQFECMFTKVSGDTPAGALGSWLALTSNRAISYAAALGTTLTGVFTVQIREIANPGNVISATVTITAESIDGGGGL